MLLYTTSKERRLRWDLRHLIFNLGQYIFPSHCWINLLTAPFFIMGEVGRIITTDVYQTSLDAKNNGEVDTVWDIFLAIILEHSYHTCRQWESQTIKTGLSVPSLIKVLKQKSLMTTQVWEASKVCTLKWMWIQTHFLVLYVEEVLEKQPRWHPDHSF